MLTEMKVSFIILNFLYMKTIFSHPHFSDMVDTLVERNPDDIQRWNVDMKTFPDGWPNIMIDNVKWDVEHQEVTYIADFSRPEDFFPNYAMIRSLVDYYADKVRVIIPYFPVGTMERISKKWEVATARYFADLLSHIPPGRKEKTSLHTFDIHALVERFLFDPFKVNAELHMTLSLLEVSKETVIAFPDDGAAKRFHEAFPENARIICAKVRDGVNRIITIKEWEPRDKDILLIDDLIQTGWTLREAAEMLRSKWAKSVRAFAPHGVFPDKSHKKIAPYLDELIVTDSIPINTERTKEVTNMSVLSIAPLIEKIIMHS